MNTHGITAIQTLTRRNDLIRNYSSSILSTPFSPLLSLPSATPSLTNPGVPRVPKTSIVTSFAPRAFRKRCINDPGASLKLVVPMALDIRLGQTAVPLGVPVPAVAAWIGVDGRKGGAVSAETVLVL